MGVLSQSKFFSELPPAELERLEGASEIRCFPAGSHVFQEGDPGDGMYVVLEGTVQISCLLGGNERRVITRLQAGEYFGEMAILDNRTRSATITAETELRLCFLPSDAVLGVLRQSPMLAVSMVREFSQRMREFHVLYTQEVVQAERLALVGRFARSIVHDFKNPLNIIGISADIAALETTPREMRASSCARIRRQVERLSNMISELLEFTRGSGTAVVLARVNFAEYVTPLIEELRTELQARSVQLVTANEPPSVMVSIDPRRLTHVFHNLVNNACDAMPEGGTLTVRFQQTDQEMETSVQDSGKGIAPEIASRLFEAFATYGKPSGTGLGLSICKRIIDDHRGRISARNTDAGGAVFSFTLPLTP